LVSLLLSNKVYIFERTTDYLGKTVEQLKVCSCGWKKTCKTDFERGFYLQVDPLSKNPQPL